MIRGVLAHFARARDYPSRGVSELVKPAGSAGMRNGVTTPAGVQREHGRGNIDGRYLHGLWRTAGRRRHVLRQLRPARQGGHGDGATPGRDGPGHSATDPDPDPDPASGPTTDRRKRHSTRSAITGCSASSPYSSRYMYSSTLLAAFWPRWASGCWASSG